MNNKIASKEEKTVEEPETIEEGEILWTKDFRR
jgi:hypothetical protein